MSGLEGYSPFDCSFGQYANYIELGLGVERGFMKMWRNGRLEVWGDGADGSGEPSVVFIPSDAELLRQLADELGSRENEYAQWKLENEEGDHSDDEDKQEHPPEWWAQMHSDATHPESRNNCPHCKTMIEAFGAMPPKQAIEKAIIEFQKSKQEKNSDKKQPQIVVGGSAALNEFALK